MLMRELFYLHGALWDKNIKDCRKIIRKTLYK